VSFQLGALPEGGLSRGVVGSDDTLVTKMRWSELAKINAVVGTCRECQGALHALVAGEHDAQGEDGQITWYDAKCQRCGKEYAAPNGRVLRRSSLNNEMPSGWLDQRRQRDREEARARQTGHPE
jgi:hypothetical protein